MSILIKGMEMPTRCFACPFCDVENSEVNCAISHGSYIEYKEIDEQRAIQDRPIWCPLIELPPHGRLIDADALNKDIEQSVVFSARQQKQNAEIRGAFKVYDRIKVAPTIIEAEGEDG